MDHKSYNGKKMPLTYTTDKETNKRTNGQTDKQEKMQISKSRRKYRPTSKMHIDISMMCCAFKQYGFSDLSTRRSPFYPLQDPQHAFYPWPFIRTQCCASKLIIMYSEWHKPENDMPTLMHFLNRQAAHVLRLPGKMAQSPLPAHLYSSVFLRLRR